MPIVQSPQVSVIIPAYNTAALISRCLDSVFAQSYSSFEVIVVNDGSPATLDLERALAPYLDRIIYIKQENKRAAGARNAAIRRGRGNFLAFLDSDDSWLPKHLDSQMDLIRKDPALDLVYADSLVGGDSTRTWRFMDRCPSRGEANFCSLIEERCQIPISTVVARKKTIVKPGMFDENLPRMDDYDMWLRAAFHGAKIRYTRQIQARLSGTRPDSLSQSPSKVAEAYCSILEKALRTLPVTPLERDVVTNRLMESKAMFQLEEAKRQLHSGQFGRARELFCEANRHFRRPELNLAVFGLGIAPVTTGKVIETWSRVRNGQPK